jgi:ABC-type Mn2+/Zn2+ transport system permease subunit
METAFNSESWDRIMIFGASAFIIVAVLILLYHEFRIFQIKDYKKKYDYVNLHEIRYFWYAVIAVIFAIALYSNSIARFTASIKIASTRRTSG